VIAVSIPVALALKWTLKRYIIEMNIVSFSFVPFIFFHRVADHTPLGGDFAYGFPFVYGYSQSDAGFATSDWWWAKLLGDFLIGLFVFVLLRRAVLYFYPELKYQNKSVEATA